MSVIGPGNLGALNIAGSLAGSGAQKTNATDGELKQNAANRSAQINRDATTAHATEDVGETESAPERDADGRLPFGDVEQDESVESTNDPQSEAGQSKNGTTRRSVDAFGERGSVLDLDA